MSGHAHKEELKLMLSLIKPKYFLPIHGEYRHQFKHKELAVSLGIPEENIMITEVGWMVEVSEDGFSRLEDIPAGNVYIDGGVIGDNVEAIIQDRKTMSHDGVMIVLCQLGTAAVSEKDIDVIYRGVITNDDFTQCIKKQVAAVFKDKKIRKLPRRDIKDRVSKVVKAYARKSMKTTPMIIPIIVTK